MVRSLRSALFALGCSMPIVAFAQTDAARPLDIPAGDLATALDTLARQSGAQFIYPAAQLKGVRTQGVQGTLTTDDALARLLRDSGFTVHRDASGAVIVVKGGSSPRRQPTPPAAACGALLCPRQPVLDRCWQSCWAGAAPKRSSLAR